MQISNAQAEQYFSNNKKYFTQSDINRLKVTVHQYNVTLDELNTVKFKSPSIAMVLSIVLGLFGADRFYSGDYVIAVIKLLTTGGWGIWWIIDWFLIGKKIKEKNAITLYAFLNGQPVPSSINIDNLKNLATSKEFQGQLKDLAESHKNLMSTMEIH